VRYPVFGVVLKSHSELLEVILLFDHSFDRIASIMDIPNVRLVHVLLVLKFQEIFEVALHFFLKQLFGLVVLAGSGHAMFSVSERLVRLSPLQVHDLLVVMKADELLGIARTFFQEARVVDVDERKTVFFLTEHFRQGPVVGLVVLRHEAMQIARVRGQLPASGEAIHAKVLGDLRYSHGFTIRSSGKLTCPLKCAAALGSLHRVVHGATKDKRISVRETSNGRLRA